MPLDETLFKDRTAQEHAKAIRNLSRAITRNMCGYEQARCELIAAAIFLEKKEPDHAGS